MNRLCVICRGKQAFFLGVLIIFGILMINAMTSFHQIIWPEALAGNTSGVPDKPLEKAFPPSHKCQRCHLRAFEEWESSAQSRSIETAPFRVTLDRYLQKRQRTSKECVFSAMLLIF